VRRLNMHQLAAIGLDDEEDDIECRVVSVAGSAAVLRQLYKPPRATRQKLSNGAFAHLVFEHHGTLVALRGVAHTPEDDGEALVFAVVDGVQLAERRAAERVAVALRATVWALNPNGGSPIGGDTVTANVSSSGALVERRSYLTGAGLLRLELHLRGGDEPLRSHARIARETPTHLGVEFIDMDEHDRLRLAIMLLRERPAEPAG